MQDRIYVMDDNDLRILEAEPFCSEDYLQRLIAEHPELLDGGQINPSDPRRWFLITRERGIADKPEGSDRWSVDHLLIDQDSIPTFVEVKRSSDSRIRREVVGQMLDYAAHATRTMTAEGIRRDFVTAHGAGSEEALDAFLSEGNGPAIDSEQFWEKVAVNLAAKRIRLLFVADEIPDELATVVEFLNEQMPNIEVLAVAIMQYQGGALRTLVPQVIGRTAGAIHDAGSSTGRQPLMRSLDEFYYRIGIQARGVAERLIRAAEAVGAETRLGSSMVTVRAHSPDLGQRCTVAELFPSRRDSRQGLLIFTLGRSNWNFFPRPIENKINGWFAQMEQDGCFESVGSKAPGGRQGWAIDSALAIDHMDLLERRLTEGIAIVQGNT